MSTDTCYLCLRYVHWPGGKLYDRRSRKSLRMIAAASLSTRFRVSSRVLPCCQRRDFASYDVERSSWRKTGTLRERAKLRAMRRASSDILLSVPSDSNGKP